MTNPTSRKLSGQAGALAIAPRLDGSASTPRDMAITLLAAGFWPVPILPAGAKLPGGRVATGKEPAGKSWGSSRATVDTLHAFFRKHPTGGIGIVLGPERGPGGAWVIDIEGDGPSAEVSRAKLFGGEVIASFGWSSPRGDHVLLTVDPARMASILARLPGEASGVFKPPSLPDLELRVGGLKPDGTHKQLQSVLPPTPGTDGAPRRWNGVEAVATAPESFYRALEGLATAATTTAPRHRAEANGRAGQPGDAEARALAYLDRVDPAVSGRNGHDVTIRAAVAVGPGFDLTPDVAYRLLAEVYNPRCVPPWSERELRHKIDDAYRIESRRGWLLDVPRDGRPKPSRNGSGTVAETGKPGRPVVEVTHERWKTLLAARAALAGDSEIYQRGNILVRVVAAGHGTPSPTDTLKGFKPRSTPVIVPVSTSWLRCRLPRLAELIAWKPDKNGEFLAIPSHPPDWLVDGLIDIGEYPNVPTLSGLAEAPFPRSDGSLAMANGYDRATGVLLASTCVARVAADPTQADAEDAARRLLGLVKQFPFRSEDDRAAWLAALLTTVARPGIAGPVPGYAVIGNRAGTGKGRLIDLIGVIATGREVPTSPYPTDPAEADKLKLALAIAGASIVHFDNLPEGANYGSGPLDSALTSLTVGGRVLGASRVVSGVELRPAWFLTGNNVAPSRDAYRRWIPINLETELERPEERDDFEVADILSHAREHRGELLGDALTILAAHAARGRPRGSWGPLGSFEGWDEVVRGAVWFATGKDCNATRRAAADEAPDRRRKLALLEAWRALPGGEYGLTVAEALTAHGDVPAFRDAIMQFSRDGKTITARTLGNVIAGMRNQTLEEMAFQWGGEEKRAIRWRVGKVIPTHPK